MEKASAEIICAVATPTGTSALSVIRVSGKGSCELVEDIMSLERDRLKGMRRKVGRIADNGRTIDEVVALSWPRGKSFTGEEMVEIICHGIPDSIMTIMGILTERGTRRAEPGEFARRAFVNGRLSAIEVIELAALWDPEKERKEFSGETEESCRILLGEIEKAREIIEGNIEFGETHLDIENGSIRDLFRALKKEAAKFREKANSLEKSRRIMIMGPANSGKSTLFNLLSGKKLALVSDEPGTTRDGSNCFLEVRGRRIHLCDTAGTDGSGLDREAFEAVMDSLDGTERVIWMSVGGRITPPDDVRNRAGEIIEIAAKSDLSDEAGKDRFLRVSSITGEGIEQINDIIARAPGNRYLSAAAERIEKSILEAAELIGSEEFDLAAELMSEAEIETRRIVGKGENILLSVERALAGMCVGK